MADQVTEDPNTVLYLYGVTEEGALLGKMGGVDGSSAIETVPCASLIAWVSRVSRKEFADNLSANMENLDWLAEASVQHQRVVSAIAQRTDMLPARFATVFLTAASLAADVRSKKRILEKDLRRIHGCDEFGVKIFRAAPKLDLPLVTAASGRDYLQAKAAWLERRGIKRKVSGSGFQKFSSELQAVAVAAAQAGKISGGQKGLEWQISLLVRRTERKNFDRLLRKYSKQWAGEHHIECTGPWPAYSFVTRAHPRDHRYPARSSSRREPMVKKKGIGAGRKIGEA
ncbi:MAG: GvpL/GvpF family gas vesicle protein [Acidobacteria bacterium]|nr:GvpL/GvpF family gas vesicle protein [Acidobacteriota bacterium]